MKTERELNKMILAVKNDITERYPELINYLTEMRVTIPWQETPVIDIKALTAYYNSLVALIARYGDNNLSNWKIVTPSTAD